jgi:hypothetical protein
MNELREQLIIEYRERHRSFEKKHLLREISKNSSAREEDDSDEKMLLSLSKMYTSSMIDSLSLLERKKKINKITDDLDDSRGFSQQFMHEESNDDVMK